MRRPLVRARPGPGPPKSHPRPLRTAQEPAKSHPRPLRTAQEPPKSVQKGSRGRPGPPRRLPGGILEAQKTFKTIKQTMVFARFREKSVLDAKSRPRGPKEGSRVPKRGPITFQGFRT